jgi:ankyrin repeat protein
MLRVKGGMKHYAWACGTVFAACLGALPQGVYGSGDGNGARDEAAIKKALPQAVYDGDMDQVRANLAACMDPDRPGDITVNGRIQSGFLPLQVAARQNNVAATELLLRAGANPNARTWVSIPPLIRAVTKTDLALARLLLESGADADTGQWYGDSLVPSVALAMAHGQSEAVQLLLDHGASEEHARISDIHRLVLRNDQSGLKRALRPGVDVDLRDALDSTPLHYAASFGRGSMVRSLLDAGADVNAVNMIGGTPLSWASSNGRVDCVSMLLAAGAEVAPSKRACGMSLVRCDCQQPTRSRQVAAGARRGRGASRSGRIALFEDRMR